MNILFYAKAPVIKSSAKSAIVLVVSDSLKLGSFAAAIDKDTGGAVSRALKASTFEGKKGQTETILGIKGAAADRVVVVGLGKEKELKALSFEQAGGSICAALTAAKTTSCQILLDLPKGCKVDAGEALARLAYGVRLRNYAFGKYHTKRKDEFTLTLKQAHVIGAGDKAAKTRFATLEKIADGVDMTRNLVTEPANVIYPKTLAEEAKKLSALGVKVEVLGRAQMLKLGMGSLLGVAQGSVHEPQLVVMQWNGAAAKSKPIAFVGKGVTFDTGGISIKPAQNMEDMKYDMAGSAAVIGLMKALAGRKAKVNAIGVVGLVENMPDGNAQRPGDVVTSMSGQTIEVINTDAEGRLVLADALWYTQDRFKPQFMINLATLTGAIVVAIGDTRCGVFSNNDTLCDRIAAASEKTGEMSWRFPLGEEYDKQINSEIADMKNVGEGRGAGSITAAQFLQRFVNDVPWAHLDIAGVAWSGKGNISGPKGATGFGVRLLNQLVADHYESK